MLGIKALDSRKFVNGVRLSRRVLRDKILREKGNEKKMKQKNESQDNGVERRYCSQCVRVCVCIKHSKVISADGLIARSSLSLPFSPWSLATTSAHTLHRLQYSGVTRTTERV